MFILWWRSPFVGPESMRGRYRDHNDRLCFEGCAFLECRQKMAHLNQRCKDIDISQMQT